MCIYLPRAFITAVSLLFIRIINNSSSRGVVETQKLSRVLRLRSCNELSFCCLGPGLGALLSLRYVGICNVDLIKLVLYTSYDNLGRDTG